jgi:hypothetical protein
MAKSKAGQAAARKLMASYAESHDRCAVCWWRKYRPGKRLELHHIAHRNGTNPHDHRNLVLLCADDHYGYHFGGKRCLTLGQILTAKKEEDGEVDMAFLASLRGRKSLLTSCEHLPSWALDERKENDGV